MHRQVLRPPSAHERMSCCQMLTSLMPQLPQYEPTIKELRAKYEAAMKEKNLGRLERDRLLARVVDLENMVAAAALDKEEARLQALAPPSATVTAVPGETVKKATSKGAVLPVSMVNPFAQDSVEAAPVVCAPLAPGTGLALGCLAMSST